jgi:cytochrome b
MIQNAIKVWDPLVRVFHWSLVICFTIAYLTGDEENSLHIFAGYAVLGLVVFRILWGFVGTSHARFKDFVFGPGKVIQYLKGLAGGSSERYIGHNPAGGYMVLLMLATLLVVTYTGLKVYGAEGHGPLAANANISVVAAAKADEKGEEGVNGEEGGESKSNPDEEYWEELHEGATNFMLGLIVLHILGIVVSSRLHKENLVKAMITGEKNVE